MTVLDERKERLKAASDSIGQQAGEDLLEQAKKAAANMLLLYGKDALSAQGFIHCVQSAHEAALLFLISEGYVELTDKGLASEDEVKARRARRDLMLNSDEQTPAEQAATRGAYL